MNRQCPEFLTFALAAILASITAATPTPASAAWKLESLELNPVRIVNTIENEDFGSFAGGVQITDDTGRNEIAIPILLVDQRDEYRDFGDFDAVRIEVQYRRYFKDEDHNGLYAGPLVRYAYFDGSHERDGSDVEEGRLGIGVVFGQRIPFGRSRFYWGYSVSAGLLFGDEIPLDSDWLDVTTDTQYETSDRHHFIDVEIAKFGFRF